jgi:hypothetical protein
MPIPIPIPTGAARGGRAGSSSIGAEAMGSRLKIIHFLTAGALEGLNVQFMDATPLVPMRVIDHMSIVLEVSSDPINLINNK